MKLTHPVAALVGPVGLVHTAFKRLLALRSASWNFTGVDALGELTHKVRTAFERARGVGGTAPTIGKWGRDASGVRVRNMLLCQVREKNIQTVKISQLGIRQVSKSASDADQSHLCTSAELMGWVRGARRSGSLFGRIGRFGASKDTAHHKKIYVCMRIPRQMHPSEQRLVTCQ